MWLRNFFLCTDDAQWKRRIRLTIVAGIVLRLLAAFAFNPHMPQMGDGPSYVKQATQILQGTIDRFYFPPGTALFSVPIFSVFGFSTIAEHAVGAVIAILLLVSTYWLAGAILGDNRPVFAATLVAAVYPHMVLSTAQISSLPLTAVLVALAIGSMARAQRYESIGWILVAGACSGFAILVRPGTVLVPMVLSVWLVHGIYRRTSKVAGAVRLVASHWVAITVLCVPVLLFHSYRGHGLVLSTNNEWNFLIANNAYTPDYKTGHFGQRGLDAIDPDAATYLRQFIRNDRPEDALLVDRRRMIDSATDYVTEHPLRTSWRVSNRFRGFWGLDYTAARELQLNLGYSDFMFGLVLLFEGGGYLVLLSFWIVWLWFGKGTSTFSSLWHLACVLAIMIPHLAAFALAKYHLPIVPVMCCGAGVVILRFFVDQEFKSVLYERRKTLIIIGVAVGIIQIEHLIQLIILR